MRIRDGTASLMSKINKIGFGNAPVCTTLWPVAGDTLTVLASIEEIEAKVYDKVWAITTECLKYEVLWWNHLTTDCSEPLYNGPLSQARKGSVFDGTTAVKKPHRPQGRWG